MMKQDEKLNLPMAVEQQSLTSFILQVKLLTSYFPFSYFQVPFILMPGWLL
jgi:hypothetical protein